MGQQKIFQQAGNLVAPLLLASIVTTLISIFVSSILFSISILCWIVDSIQKRKLQIRFPPFSPFLLTFVGLILIAVVFSTDPAISVKSLKKLVRYLPFFLLFTYVRSNQAIRTLKWIYFLAGASAIWGIVQYYWIKDVDLLNRISGFMSHWMTFSGQMMLVGISLFAYLFFLWLKSGQIKFPFCLALTLGFILWALILTGTRSAWIGLIGGVFMLLLFIRIRWVGLAIAVVVVVFFLLPASFQKRFYSGFDFNDATTHGRIVLLQTSARIVRDYPLTGVGPRLAGKKALEYRIENEFPEYLYQHLHNNLLQITVELGIPAAIVWCLFWLKILLDCLRFYFVRKENAALRLLSLNTICLILAFQLMGMFEYNFGDAEIAFLLFFMVTVPYISAQESASVKNSSRDEKLRIAILGTRGIPANYGGFETFAEELSKRLVSRGHNVIVYCRSHYVDTGLKFYNGVKLIHHPAIRHKYLDTISHTFISSFDVLFRKLDVVLICNAANAFLSWIPRISGKAVVINVDGIERLRKKWNWLGRLFYLLNERLATLFPDKVVTDARTIKRYYLERYNCDSSFIPYGSSPEIKKTTEILNQLEILKNKYLLYVSRLEPENNAHLVIQAYLQTRLQVPLVLVGDAPYSEKYISDLKALASQGNVLMPGAIYGGLYRELISHCLCYLHATEVGGTHPALIEAMGVGAIVVANDTEENREVLGETGILCQFDDTNKLAELLKRIGQHPENYSDLSAMAAARARHHYNWDQVTNQYEDLFYELVK